MQGYLAVGHFDDHKSIYFQVEEIEAASEEHAKAGGH